MTNFALHTASQRREQAHSARSCCGTRFAFSFAMTPEQPKKTRSKDELIIATAVAVVCAFALVVLAARQTPVAGRGRPGLSRAQINAAEERAIWADPKIATSSGGPIVTMTGCVEKRGDGYRLTDTEGDDAPRARNWKSGFFRKGTVALDLVDGGQTAPFKHVGERVRVIGTLDDRELTVRSLRRVADSCS